MTRYSRNPNTMNINKWPSLVECYIYSRPIKYTSIKRDI